MKKLQSNMSMAEKDDIKSATLYDAAIAMLAEAVLLAHNVEYVHDDTVVFNPDFVAAHFTEHNDIFVDIYKFAESILTDPR